MLVAVLSALAIDSSISPIAEADLAHYRPYYHRHVPVRRPVPVYTAPAPAPASRRICSSIESFVTIYESPYFNSLQVSRLSLGTLVEPLEEVVRDRIDWARIQYPGGAGWIPANKLCAP